MIKNAGHEHQSIQKSIENLSQPSIDNLASFTIQQLNFKSSSRLGTITEGEEDFCKSKSSHGDRPALFSQDKLFKVTTNPTLPATLDYQDKPSSSKRLFSERVPSPKPIVHEELSPSYGEEKNNLQGLWRHQEIIQPKALANLGSKLTKKEPNQQNEIGSRQKSLPSKPDQIAFHNQYNLNESSKVTRNSKGFKAPEQVHKSENEQLKLIHNRWEQEERLKFQSALNKLGRLEHLVIQLQQQVSRSRATQIIF